MLKRAAASLVRPCSPLAGFRETDQIRCLILENMKWKFLLAGALAFIAGFLSTEFH
jgi:hypothetical protein